MFTLPDAAQFCCALPSGAVICPPATLLASLVALHLPIVLGAQDCSAFEDADHTGDISASMLAQLGAKYVLVGHSERRHKLGEDKELVAQKAACALNAGLTPIVCIGETAQERLEGKTQAVLAQQLAALLSEVPIVAYEPVWAIGQNLTEFPLEELTRVCTYIRSLHRGLLLYGGSVKPETAHSLYTNLPINGLLVGAASRHIDSFCAIMKAVA